MKQWILVLSFVLQACSSQPRDSELKAAPPIPDASSYGVFITNTYGQLVVNVVNEFNEVIALSSCIRGIAADPFEQGRTYPAIDCPTRNSGVNSNKVTAHFGASLRSSPKLWPGSVTFTDMNVTRTSAYVCFEDNGRGHFMECYYKPGATPPSPAGGVSN